MVSYFVSGTCNYFLCISYYMAIELMEFSGIIYNFSCLSNCMARIEAISNLNTSIHDGNYRTYSY